MARRFFQTPEARWVADLEQGDPGAKADAALRLASLARERGDHGRAETLLRAVIQDAEPGTAARAAFALAEVLATSAGDAGLALDLARGIGRPELAPDVVNNIAARDYAFGDVERAAAAYRSVIDAFASAAAPDELVRDEAGIAALRLAELLGEQGDADGAIRAWRQAVAIGEAETAPRAAFALARVLLQRDQADSDAPGLLELAVSFDHPDCSPAAALELARVRERAGDTASAYDLAQLVADCGHPDYAPDASEMLERLLARQMERYFTDVLERQWASGPLNEPPAVAPAARRPAATWVNVRDDCLAAHHGDCLAAHAPGARELGPAPAELFVGHLAGVTEAFSAIALATADAILDCQAPARERLRFHYERVRGAEPDADWCFRDGVVSLGGGRVAAPRWHGGAAGASWPQRSGDFDLMLPSQPGARGVVVCVEFKAPAAQGLRAVADSARVVVETARSVGAGIDARFAYECVAGARRALRHLAPRWRLDALLELVLDRYLAELRRVAELPHTQPRRDALFLVSAAPAQLSAPALLAPVECPQERQLAGACDEH